MTRLLLGHPRTALGGWPRAKGIPIGRVSYRQRNELGLCQHDKHLENLDQSVTEQARGPGKLLTLPLWEGIWSPPDSGHSCGTARKPTGISPTLATILLTRLPCPPHHRLKWWRQRLHHTGGIHHLYSQYWLRQRHQFGIGNSNRWNSQYLVN